MDAHYAVEERSEELCRSHDDGEPHADAAPAREPLHCTSFTVTRRRQADGFYTLWFLCSLFFKLHFAFRGWSGKFTGSHVIQPSIPLARGATVGREQDCLSFSGLVEVWICFRKQLEKLMMCRCHCYDEYVQVSRCCCFF